MAVVEQIPIRTRHTMQLYTSRLIDMVFLNRRIRLRTWIDCMPGELGISNIATIPAHNALIGLFHRALTPGGLQLQVLRAPANVARVQSH